MNIYAKNRTSDKPESRLGRASNLAGNGGPLAVSDTPSRMLACVRRDAIVERLRLDGSVMVAEIATEFGVSEMTIRRDLTDLEREGRLSRTHGGAVANPLPLDRDEPSFDDRLGRQRDAKERIAAEAAGLLGEARTIALDVGATTYLLAERLRDRFSLDLFTASLRIATALAGHAPRLHVPGGQVNGTEMAVGGPVSLAGFSALWFDLAFIGVSGITADGLYDYSQDDAAMKRVYLARSARKIVLCDSAKFQRMALVCVAPLAGIDLLLTDAPPPEALAAALHAAGVAVRIAGAAG